MSWESRIVGSGEEAPDQLMANPRNWRIHPKEQQDALSLVIDRVGWVKEVVVNRTTGAVIDGHLRVGLALSKGEPSIPVKYVELSENEERAVIATLDPIGEMAETDQDALDSLIDDLEGSGSNPDLRLSEDPADSVLRVLDEFHSGAPDEPRAPKGNGLTDDGGGAGAGKVLAICPGCCHEWEVPVG